MQYKNIGKYNISSILIFLSGCLGLIAVTVLDKLYWQINILTIGYPDFSPSHLVRSVVVFASVGAVLWALIGKYKPRVELSDHHKFPVEIFCISATLLISFIFLWLFIFYPIVFSISSIEDGPVEWGSAFLAFLSCIVLTISVLKYRKNKGISGFTKVSLVILSLIFFAIAMEEVSWFQRVFNYKTMGIFDGNEQNEANLHNFATEYFNNMYYIGTWLFFVVLPFIYLLNPLFSKNKYLQLFVARPYIAVISTVACAYNFDQWNVLLTQVSFFSSLIILFAFAVFSTSKKERHIIMLTITLVILTQALFLIRGEEVFLRLWEIKEYKEFFIPLAFFIYSGDISSRIKAIYLSEKS